MATQSKRHEPCAILHERGVPCVLWFEDALAQHGVPTVVFDLHLLVADVDEAALALNEAGWTDTKPRINHFLTDSAGKRRLNPPGFSTVAKGSRTWPPPPPSQEPPGPTTTVLLPAADWNITDQELGPQLSEGFVPSLPLLLGALIDSLLDSPSNTALRARLVTYVSYLYDHCASLKAQSFAENLKPEHRQFHCDALSKTTLGTAPFIEEQRQIREEVKAGKRQPHRWTWYLSGEVQSNQPELKQDDLGGEPAADELAVVEGLAAPNISDPTPLTEKMVQNPEHTVPGNLVSGETSTTLESCPDNGGGEPFSGGFVMKELAVVETLADSSMSNSCSSTEGKRQLPEPADTLLRNVSLGETETTSDEESCPDEVGSEPYSGGSVVDKPAVVEAPADFTSNSTSLTKGKELPDALHRIPASTEASSVPVSVEELGSEKAGKWPRSGETFATTS